jgi:hypothetical protein
MLTFALAVLLTGSSVTSEGAAPARPLSRVQAEALQGKIDGLARLVGKGTKKNATRTVEISEDEVNSYLNLALLPTLPAAVSDVDVRFQQDGVAAKGVVDIDEIKGRLSLSPWNPLSFLSGDLPVAVSGHYAGGKDGFGQVIVDEVRAGGVSLPVSMLEQVVASFTKSPSLPRGFDLTAPFRLPEPVKRVRLLPGRAFLDL